jgi:hypothetical protein
MRQPLVNLRGGWFSFFITESPSGSKACSKPQRLWPSAFLSWPFAKLSIFGDPEVRFAVPAGVPEARSILGQYRSGSAHDNLSI